MPGQIKGRKRRRTHDEDDNNEDDDEVSFNVPQAKKVKTEECDQEPRRSPNGYILPDPLPEGLVIQDLRGKKWKLGKSVGLGGFGEVYSAALLNGKKKSPEDFVVKVEPHSNGPLFVEINFYCRATRSEDIENFANARNIAHLGIPAIQGSGSFVFARKRLRFIVLPRYGTDLQTVLDESKSSLSLETASSIAIQVLNSYEYLHSKGYAHKDVKGSNLLFGRGDSTDRKKVFLVDYGLTSRFVQMGLHKPFYPDIRSAHEGTLEYTSRDAHLGCVSRRGDIEVLLYNIIDWMGGKLPWELDEPLKPTVIHDMKTKAFRNVHGFLSAAFDGRGYPAVLEHLMTTIKEMPFEEAPDYNYLRQLFTPFCDDDHDDCLSGDEVVLSLELSSSLPGRSSVVKRRKVAKKVADGKVSTSRPWSGEQMAVFRAKKLAVLDTRARESLANPTPAMVEQMKRLSKRQSSSAVFTRRKGAVAKRRINKDLSNSVEGKFVLVPAEFGDSGRPKGDEKSSPTTRSTSLRQSLAKMVSVPHFGIVSNLVKTIFPFQQREKEGY